MKKMLRKAFVLAVALVMLLQVMPMVGAEELIVEQIGEEIEAVSEPYIVCRDTKLMSMPTGGSMIVASVSAGTKVFALGSYQFYESNYNYNYVPVRCNGKIGYIQALNLCSLSRCYKTKYATNLVMQKSNCRIAKDTYVFVRNADPTILMWDPVWICSGDYFGEYGAMNRNALAKVG